MPGKTSGRSRSWCCYHVVPLLSIGPVQSSLILNGRNFAKFLCLCTEIFICGSGRSGYSDEPAGVTTRFVLELSTVASVDRLDGLNFPRAIVFKVFASLESTAEDSSEQNVIHQSIVGRRRYPSTGSELQHPKQWLVVAVLNVRTSSIPT